MPRSCGGEGGGVSAQYTFDFSSSLGPPRKVFQCTRCGAQIIAWEVRGDFIISDFRNEKGECGRCDDELRKLKKAEKLKNEQSGRGVESASLTVRAYKHTLENRKLSYCT